MSKRIPKQIPNLTSEQIDRFWSKVDRRGPDECWEWQAGLDKDGYGKHRIGSRHLRAHRIAYFLGHAKQPAGKCVCHDYDNPPCCNPAHLFLGTNAENMWDCTKKDRRPQGIKHSRTFFSEEHVIDILLSNESQTMLAKQYQTLPTTINNIQRRVTWRHVRPDIPPRSMIKLTNEDVIHIKQSDKYYAELAVKYGVARSTIDKIRNNKARNKPRKEIYESQRSII
ncbi:MAG TPA: HNH endonuclease signature motif containing protein [Thermoguttaceae bacterium]